MYMAVNDVIRYCTRERKIRYKLLILLLLKVYQNGSLLDPHIPIVASTVSTIFFNLQTFGPPEIGKDSNFVTNVPLIPRLEVEYIQFKIVNGSGKGGEHCLRVQVYGCTNGEST